MAANLAQVLIAISPVKTPIPAGLSAGAVSVVVTDSSGAAQAAVSLTGSETPPFSFTTSLPISADGVTVSASVAQTSLDSTGTAIPGATRTDTLSLTEPTFNAPGAVTMTLTPAAVAANPTLAAAVKKH
jgi:hypothetical protein